MLKLHLGCGSKKIDDHVNVDMYPQTVADVLHDLNIAPWPWEDNLVSEVTMIHSLEHMGETVDQFRTIMQELYRVCCDGAIIHIAVPHVFCNNFWSDPTHVRPITHDLLVLFSKKACANLQAQGAANTPLAIFWDIDFEIAKSEIVVDPMYQDFVGQPGFEEMMRSKVNFIVELRFDLRVVKEDINAAYEAGILKPYIPDRV